MNRRRVGSSSSAGRRAFVKTALAGLAAAGLAPIGLTRRVRAAGLSDTASAVPFVLGVATYSLREFSRAEAIEMLRKLHATSVSIKSHHLPYEAEPQQLASGVDEFEAAGMDAVSCGVVTFTEDTDEHVQRYFDYAKHARIPMMVIAAAPDILPRIEKFVKSYGISVAIHNHGPEDEYYPAPSDAIGYIKDMDPRVGVCVDVGHTTRTGADVVQAMADAGARLLDIHMKDLADLMVKESQVAVGQGQMPVPEMFAQLTKMNYTGNVNLEYEINKEDPLEGMIESMAYMRGVVAALGASR